MTSQIERSVEERRAARVARDAALERWTRLRAGGRSAFIWRHGVVGWGLPAAVVTAAYKVVEAQGFGWPADLEPGLRAALVLIALVFPALGYVLGGWLWTQGEARYERLLREREAEGGPRRE